MTSSETRSGFALAKFEYSLLIGQCRSLRWSHDTLLIKFRLYEVCLIQESYCCEVGIGQQAQCRAVGAYTPSFGKMPLISSARSTRIMETCLNHNHKSPNEFVYVCLSYCNLKFNYGTIHNQQLVIFLISSPLVNSFYVLKMDLGCLFWMSPP